MPDRIVVVGSGICGLTAAYLLIRSCKTAHVTVIDAGSPATPDSVQPTCPGGATFGAGLDARHFTGSEGISLRTSGIESALRTVPWAPAPGGVESECFAWLCVNRELSNPESDWREDYPPDIGADPDPLDASHVLLNYGGMAAWNRLKAVDPSLETHCIDDDGVLVFFEAGDRIKDDFNMEQGFEQAATGASTVCYVDASQVGSAGGATLVESGLDRRALLVPGSSWRIRSLGQHLLNYLAGSGRVEFRWGVRVEHAADLPQCDAVIWTTGSSVVTPEPLRRISRVQGLAGFWMSLPNHGFERPFKICAPQPSAYINFTPDGDSLLVSGGFAWVGRMSLEEVSELSLPAKAWLVRHIEEYLGAGICSPDIGLCIRPSTRTGLPDIWKMNSDGTLHLGISGSTKAGATHAA